MQAWTDRIIEGTLVLWWKDKFINDTQLRKSIRLDSIRQLEANIDFLRNFLRVRNKVRSWLYALKMRESLNKFSDFTNLVIRLLSTIFVEAIYFSFALTSLFFVSYDLNCSMRSGSHNFWKHHGNIKLKLLPSES